MQKRKSHITLLYKSTAWVGYNIEIELIDIFNNRQNQINKKVCTPNAILSFYFGKLFSLFVVMAH